MTKEIVYLVIYVKVHTGVAELDPLQVLCNDTCTALKLAQYCININIYQELKSNSERAIHGFIHCTFNTNARVLISTMMFYDVKLQSVKTPVAARISPNHTCQSSLSYI